MDLLCFFLLKNYTKCEEVYTLIMKKKYNVNYSEHEDYAYILDN